MNKFVLKNNNLSGLKLNLIWSRNKEAISTGTINLNSDDYDALVFEYYGALTSTTARYEFTLKGGTITLQFINSYSTSNHTQFATRAITYVSNTVYTIGKGYSLDEDFSAYPKEDNSAMIPTKVYGIKFAQ